MQPTGLPRLELGRWPTPVRRLDATSAACGVEVWAKVEGDCGVWGGNKVRKLEYLLGQAEARRDRRLVTFGAGTSSWAAACALHGSAHGWPLTVALAGPLPEAYRRLYRGTGATVVRLPHVAMTPAAATIAAAAAARSQCRLLSPGGSGPIGDAGSLGAGQELAAQIEAGQAPRPDAVFVACGTGGTAAGLAAGMGMAGLRVPVVAVRVTPRPLGTPRLVRRRLSRLATITGGFSAAPVIGDDRAFGDGYAKPGPGLDEALRLAFDDGLETDAVYAGKALAALIRHARKTPAGCLLLLHTSAPGAPSVSEVPSG